MYKKKGQSKIKIALLLTLISVLALVCFFAYRASFDSQGDKTTTTDGKKVNLNPATQNEQNDADRQKEINLEKETQETPKTDQANVVITNATNRDVRGYITNVFEEGGICTATAVQGTQSISKSSEGFSNVSYTQCAPIEWDTPLSAGVWDISLQYVSSSYSGSQSKSLSVE